MWNRVLIVGLFALASLSVSTASACGGGGCGGGGFGGFSFNFSFSSVGGCGFGACGGCGGGPCGGPVAMPPMHGGPAPIMPVPRPIAPVGGFGVAGGFVGGGCGMGPCGGFGRFRRVRFVARRGLFGRQVVRFRAVMF